MEKRQKQTRTGTIRIRVSAAEMEQIEKHRKQSTDRSLSAYLRRLATNRPVTIKIRNASADDFLKEMIPLRTVLQQLTATFDVAATRLQVLEKIPEFKTWLLLHQTTSRQIAAQVANIESLMIQLYEQWLQK